MRTIHATTALMLAGCALAAPTMTATPKQQPFPTASEGIEIDAAGGDGGSTLADVLRDFSRATGQNFSISPQTRQMLEATPVGLLNSVSVPPAQVFSFVEGLLIRNDFVATRLRGEAPALLGLYSMNERRNRAIGGQAMRVASEDVASFAEHPALLIRTVLDVSPANAKDVASALRHLCSDQSLYSVTHSGAPSSVILQGPGSWVVDTVATIEEVVANHATYLRPFQNQNPSDSDSESGK
jgi:type II secretory pathway component GspD/PulD (secretin)